MTAYAKILYWAVAMFGLGVFVEERVGTNVHTEPVFALEIALVLFLSGCTAIVCVHIIACKFAFRKLKR